MFIKVKAHPGEKKNKVLQKGPGSFEIWTKEPAEQGRANAAVKEMLAAALGVESKKLSLIKGGTSPSKIFSLHPSAEK